MDENKKYFRAKELLRFVKKGELIQIKRNSKNYIHWVLYDEYDYAIHLNRTKHEINPTNDFKSRSVKGNKYEKGVVVREKLEDITKGDKCRINNKQLKSLKWALNRTEFRRFTQTEIAERARKSVSFEYPYSESNAKNFCLFWKYNVSDNHQVKHFCWLWKYNVSESEQLNEALKEFIKTVSNEAMRDSLNTKENERPCDSKKLIMASTEPQTSGQTKVICGFDVGSENCYIAVARNGGIDVLTNEYSQTSTPAYIGFGGNHREFGVSAKHKQIMNLNNTCFAPNRLIGRTLYELTEEYPFRFEAEPNGDVFMRVCHNNEELVLTGVQLMAMLLTELHRQVSSESIDCVINCPIYFNDSQRRALMNSAVIAGLSPLRIVSDMTAISFYYGIYRTDPFEQKPKIVAFVDCGHNSTQCSIVLFNNKEKYMKVLANEYEINLGGKQLNELIANYFIQKHNLTLNNKSRIRLIAECEKLKKEMSAIGISSMPISIECLYDKTDFNDKIDSEIFEKLAEPLFIKINDVFIRAIHFANEKFVEHNNNNGILGEFQNFSCEIVGGSSRLPAIKGFIRSTFGVDASTTLNADEAVSLGCALQCAILSPSMTVNRQMQVLDFNPFEIQFRYWSESDDLNSSYSKSVRVIFPRGYQMPSERQITINCQSLPFIASLDYVNDCEQVIPIGEFRIDFSEPNQIINNQIIKLNFRLDPNGIVSINSASLLIEGISLKNWSSIDLKVETLWIRGKLNDDDILKFKEIEMNLTLADKNYKEKIDAKNALEEYLNEWREEIESDIFLDSIIKIGGNYRFGDTKQKKCFLNELQTAQQWLNDQEEEDQLHSKLVYEKYLSKLEKSFKDKVIFD